MNSGVANTLPQTLVVRSQHSIHITKHKVDSNLTLLGMKRARKQCTPLKVKVSVFMSCNAYALTFHINKQLQQTYAR
jgi:hypothetical protein